MTKAVETSREAAERILRKEVVIDAPVRNVWHTWTTEEGLKAISPRSNVSLEIGGSFEWFLHLEPDERGRRGGEGSKILAFLPLEMLAFDWTFPPSIPELRLTDAKTQVVLRFEDLGENGTRIHFAQLGWQQGEHWDAGYLYFDEAWDLVLTRMKAHLESAR